MGVLAVQALLIPIHPALIRCEKIVEERLIPWLCKGISHGLPIEATLVANAASVGQPSEVDFTQQFFEFWEELMEGRGIFRDC
jgi:hypothetical protein